MGRTFAWGGLFLLMLVERNDESEDRWKRRYRKPINSGPQAGP